MAEGGGREAAQAGAEAELAARQREIQMHKLWIALIHGYTASKYEDTASTTQSHTTSRVLHHG